MSCLSGLPTSLEMDCKNCDVMLGYLREFDRDIGKVFGMEFDKEYGKESCS